MNTGAPIGLHPGAAPRGRRGAARIALRAAVVLLAAAVLAGVFTLYLQPEFLRALADQVWACL